MIAASNLYLFLVKLHKNIIATKGVVFPVVVYYSELSEDTKNLGVVFAADEDAW